MKKKTTLADFYAETPFTLALSSGFFGFFAHLGFVKALEEKKIFPTAYTGSSAGAIVSGALASGWSARELEELFLKVKFNEFFDPRPGLGLVRGKLLEKLLAKYMKLDFKDLQKPLRISLFDIFKARTVSFTEGNLPKICRASCSIPFVFHPVMVDSRLYWDGGILDKRGVSGLSPDEPVLIHFLSSNIYERNALNPGFGPPWHQVKLKEIPGCGPHKLHLGKEIIDAASKQTREILEEPSVLGVC